MYLGCALICWNFLQGLLIIKVKLAKATAASRHTLNRAPVWDTGAGKKARLHRCGCGDTRAWHRCEHGDLHCCQRWLPDFSPTTVQSGPFFVLDSVDLAR